MKRFKFMNIKGFNVLLNLVMLAKIFPLQIITERYIGNPFKYWSG